MPLIIDLPKQSQAEKREYVVIRSALMQEIFDFMADRMGGDDDMDRQDELWREYQKTLIDIDNNLVMGLIIDELATEGQELGLEY